MSEELRGEELAALIERVFRPRPEEGTLAILVDVPDSAVLDNPAWRERRELAGEWARSLAALRERTGILVHLYHYRNVGQNNGDLPRAAVRHNGERALPNEAAELDRSCEESFARVLAAHPLVLAVTEFSATAPLKLLAQSLNFRAATMPGFNRAMVPALRLDYDDISRRVSRLTQLLDEAESCDLHFEVDSGSACRLLLDLRHRRAHASTGLIHEPGTAGNLPSGEAYIVPYEGECEGDPSRSEGQLPVQLGEEVVSYRVEGNRARSAEGPGPAAQAEAERLSREPAYGNIAELGLGVLGDLGIEPAGELLLDEKLGLHIAFGRSDHFGGQVGAAQFFDPAAVVHLDRVYVRSMQPRISVRSVDLVLPGGFRMPLMRDDRYVIEL